MVASSVLPHVGCGDGRPTIVVRPDGEAEVLYETAELGHGSWLARRTGGTWTATGAPDFTSAAFALGASGCGYAWLDRSGAGTGLYEVDGDTFTLLRAEDATWWVRAGQLAIDPLGGVHMVGLVGGRPATVDITVFGWVERPASWVSEMAVPAAMGVGPDGSLQRLWEDATRPGFAFYDLDGTVSPIFPSSGTGTPAIEQPSWALAISDTPGSGHPRMLLDDSQTLSFASRYWDTSRFVVDNVVPQATPVGLVASSDDTAVGVAIDVGPYANGLYVVPFDGYHVTERQYLRVGIHARNGSTALGPDGHLHIAVCANDDDLVHYYEVASSPAP